jgi:hypothetical protein
MVANTRTGKPERSLQFSHSDWLWALQNEQIRAESSAAKLCVHEGSIDRRRNYNRNLRVLRIFGRFLLPGTFLFGYGFVVDRRVYLILRLCIFFWPGNVLVISFLPNWFLPAVVKRFNFNRIKLDQILF